MSKEDREKSCIKKLTLTHFMVISPFGPQGNIYKLSAESADFNEKSWILG